MNVDQLIQEFKKKLDGDTQAITTGEFGTISAISDGIATVKGLPNCMASEMLRFENGSFGIALNLDADSIGVVILGEYNTLKEGDKVERTEKVLSIPVSENCLGRVVDPLMQPIDGQGSIDAKTEYPIEKIAPGVMTREPVSQPLDTGITAIDALVPVGRGQRELIIGDRQTGKTAIAIDTIVNQKGKDVQCVYVAIGQKRSKVMRIVESLRAKGAMDYTTVVLAGASDNPALLYLAPYAGVTLAEYLMDQKKDVLVIYDDLSKHAVAYREISLLLRRPPGREAFPGDVFYLHSRLLERACRRNEQHGGGSITALPIIETKGGDVSGYIPTNVISITDGQIFLESSLFNKGVRPAINPGISVSRIGGAAQIRSMKKNAGPLKLAMAQYRELESFAQFDSDLDPDTKRQLERGKRAIEVMKQGQLSPLRTAIQVSFIYALNNGLLDDVPVDQVSRFKDELEEYLDSAHRDLLDSIESGWDDDIKSNLDTAIKDFVQGFKTA